MRFLQPILLALVGFSVALPAPHARRTLVIADDTNSDPELAAEVLAEPLRQRGHEVTAFSGLRGHPALVDLGERQYDNLIVIPGATKALGKGLTAKKLVEFIELGGNIVALTTPRYSPVALRDTAAQLGITVSSRATRLVDHFSDNIELVHPDLLWSDAPLTLSNETSVAYLGDNDQLAMPLARAPARSYAYNYLNEEDTETLVSSPFVTGRGGIVAAALQTLDGARFVWTGLSDLLSGESGAQLTSWAFQERGVLRLAGEPLHQSVNDGLSHHVYRVNEPVKWCSQFEQWDGQEWIKYNPTDAQLEFRMLDPYYRVTLDSNGCAEFVTPDQHGMFTFLLDYKRPGQTFLEYRQVVTMRHMANDEWPRSWSITNSWVYMSGATTTVLAFIIFVVVYLSLPTPQEVVPKTVEAKDPKVIQESHKITPSPLKKGKKIAKK